MKCPNTDAGTYRRSPAVTIRWAEPADAPALSVLADLDEARVPAAPLLLAEVDGELWVAMSARTGEAICDPFRPSLEVSVLVRERTRQLTIPERDRPRLAAVLKPRWSSSASLW